MHFRDTGIIISSRPLKEGALIVTLFTQNHGLYSGVVRRPIKKADTTHQVGNVVDFFWQARLDEHIGLAKCELVKAYSGLIISNKARLYIFNSIISLIKLAFHEREPHNNFFLILEGYVLKLIKLTKLTTSELKDYIEFELAILAEAGYGLQLHECGATGSTENLQYVSPRSGKAICYEAGLPYKDKLLALPQFLNSEDIQPTLLQKQQAFALTSYFINRYFLHDKAQPAARAALIEYISA